MLPRQQQTLPQALVLPPHLRTVWASRLPLAVCGHRKIFFIERESVDIVEKKRQGQEYRQDQDQPDDEELLDVKNKDTLLHVVGACLHRVARCRRGSESREAVAGPDPGVRPKVGPRL